MFADLTEEKCKKVLLQAICNILVNCKERPVFRIVTLDRLKDVEKGQDAAEITLETNSTNPDSAEHMDTSLVNNVNEERGFSASSNLDDEEIAPDVFHASLVINDFETIDEVEKFYSDHYTILSNRFGVLLYLYSVIFTKGIENILNEISDTSSTPLIQNSFDGSYASQSLINLM
jgi:ubiquitin carboxyl-terminal hydrolase MINDY-3/4